MLTITWSFLVQESLNENRLDPVVFKLTVLSKYDLIQLRVSFMTKCFGL